MIKNCGDLPESLAFVGEEGLIELDGLKEDQDDHKNSAATSAMYSDHLREIPRVVRFSKELLKTVWEQRPNRPRYSFYSFDFVPFL